MGIVTSTWKYICHGLPDFDVRYGYPTGNRRRQLNGLNGNSKWPMSSPSDPKKIPVDVSVYEKSVSE